MKALAANAALLNQRIREDAWEGLTPLEVAVKRAVRPVSGGDMRLPSARYSGMICGSAYIVNSP